MSRTQLLELGARRGRRRRDRRRGQRRRLRLGAQVDAGAGTLSRATRCGRRGEDHASGRAARGPRDGAPSTPRSTSARRARPARTSHAARTLAGRGEDESRPGRAAPPSPTPGASSSRSAPRRSRPPPAGIDADRRRAPSSTRLPSARRGTEVVLVSSGAIAAGLAPLGLAARPRDLATQQAAASVGQGLLVHRYTEAFARHGITVGQVLLTADDVTRRTHYRNAQRTLDRAARARRAAGRQRERHRRHRRRSGSATTTGWPRSSRTSCTPTCWCCSPTSTALYDGDPRAAAAHAGSPTSAAPPTSTASPSGDAAAAGRHRRHGDQGRGGPDRDRRRHPGRADVAPRTPPRRSPASPSAPVPRRPAAPVRPGCSGSRTRPSRAGAPRARRRRRPRRRRAPRLAAARRHHRRSTATSTRATRSTLSTKAATRRPRSGQLRRPPSSRRCSAARPRELARELGARTNARSSTATTCPAPPD